MKSLERHLQIWLAVSLIILIALFWVVGNRSMHHITENFIVERLEHDTEHLLNSLDIREQQLKLHFKRINTIYHTLNSGHYFVMTDSTGELFKSTSLGKSNLQVNNLQPGERRLFRQQGPQDQLLLVLVQGKQFHNRSLTFAVAEDLSKIKQQRNQFKKIFAILAGVGLLSALLAQSMVVRRAMRRLESVRREIEQLEHSASGTLSEDVPDEIRPVVEEFNQLLKLLEARLERSRNALGNLSHALKGPLTILMQYFDTQHQQDPKDKQLGQVKQQAERIHQLIDRELKHARLAGSSVSKRHFNPAEELPDLVSVIQQIHQPRQVQINYQVDKQVKPFADQEDMLELIGNLLDNACKWARSSVNCEIIASPLITICIEDDGLCLSGSKLDQLSQRGVRLDETVDGHGLGLAICKDIVSLYGGQISFDCSPTLGGLRVKVAFP